MLLKVCGMKFRENIIKVAELKPDYMGFIFYAPSKRYAEPLDELFMQQLALQIKTTAVFVNESISTIREVCKRYGFKAVQLHGNESPEMAQALREDGLEVFKVFLLEKNYDFAVMMPYLNVCDYFLFDTKSEGHGGSGVAFDWSVLHQYPYDKPFFLSGGLSLQNVEGLTALQSLPLAGIDVNSKFELEPGRKDVSMLRDLRWRLS